MKKNNCINGKPMSFRRWKIFLIMKLLAIFILGLIFQSNALDTRAQDKRLSLKFENNTLKEVLLKLQDQTEFSFIYKDEMINPINMISGNFKDEKVTDLLNKVLQNTGLTYTIEGRAIVILSNDSEIVTEQQKSVSGKVTDSTGAGLPGVSVVLKGTTIGVITDMDGKYTLAKVPENAVLQFSFVGMKSQEIPIGGKTTINVKLEEETVGIDEVVAIGYGTARRKDLTGSVATINQDNLKDKPVSSVDQQLVGQIAGVQIQTRSGKPGGGSSMKIRGNGSIGAGNEPLYVVDGMPYSEGLDVNLNPLAFINPNDIESISILKDASSTAIYGSRGSNGVVMITTKKGSYGQTSVNVSAMQGIQQVPDKGRPNMMNQQEFADLQREKIGALVRVKENREPTSADYPKEYLPENLVGPGTDWYDLILRPAKIQDYNINLNKGTKETRLNFSMGYFNQEGVVKYTGLERYSGKLSMESNIGNSVKVGASLQPTFIKQVNTTTNTDRSDIIGLATWANPVMKPYDASGNLLQYIYQPANKYAQAWSFVNPLIALRDAQQNQTTFQNLGIAYLEWQIISGLKVKSSMNTNFSNANYFQYIPSTVGGANSPPSPATGRSFLNRGSSFSWVLENTLTYDKTIGKHKINSMVGYTTQKSKADYINLNPSPYSNDLIQTINAAQAIKTWGQAINEWSMISYLGRINYSYDDKYLFTATVRSDGSSRFGENNRYAIFPSVAGAWRMSEEGFLKGNKVIDNLKLRVSYGRSGNDNIGNYSHLASINSGAYIFGTTQVTASRFGVSNPYLTWEESGQIDAGIDLALFKNRLNFVIDYYNRKSINMLLNDVIPAITGFNNQMVNKGNVRNTGFEFSVDGTPVDKELKWDMNLNLSFNRNKVLSLNNNGDPIFGYADGGNMTHITAVGKPIGQYYGFVFEGIYTAADIADPKVPKNQLSTEGSRKYKDVNGDGTITGVLDYAPIGNPCPDFIFGFTNNLTYRNFDLSVVVNGQYGGQVVNGVRNTVENLHAFFNVDKAYVNRWRSASDPGDGIHGKVVLYPGGVDHVFNNLWLEDATYLKISNLTFGYSLPKSIMKRTGFITNCRLNLSIQNLAMFTKYSGANPEAQPVSQNNDLIPGWDISSYPLSRTTSLGINFSF